MDAGGWYSFVRQGSWKIAQSQNSAHAVDEAYGFFGRIWRATYIESNSDQNIVITRLDEVSAETTQILIPALFRQGVSRATWVIALIVGLCLWVVTWYWVMNRAVRARYSFRQGRLYKDALLWSLVRRGIS